MDRIYEIYRMRRKKINPVILVNPVHFRVPSAGCAFAKFQTAPLHRRSTINLSLAKRISQSSSRPTGLNFRSVSLSAEEMLAWQVLSDAKWRELRWLDLSRQGVE
jgi:hypothetical protein